MLTERMQMKAIYDAFISKEGTDLNPKLFMDPWRTIFLLAEREQEFPTIMSITPLRTALQSVAADEEQQREWMRMIEIAAETPYFPNAEELGAGLDDITWVWQDWIPRGMLSLVGGYPGTGKSYFVMDVVRATIAGGTWPDGKPIESTGNVVYIDAEGVPQINNERVKALGVDGKHLYFLLPEDGKIMDLTERYWQDKLIEMVLLLKPELVVVDSLSAITLKSMNTAEDVAPLLTFFVALASFANCGMMMVHHLRKPPTSQLSLYGVSIHDFRGSQHIIAYARTVFGLSIVQASGQSFSLNGSRRIDMVKTNFSNWTEPLGLSQERDGDQIKFVYSDAPTQNQDSSVQEECELWLIEYLEENGPSPASDVIEAGDGQGFSESTIYRASRSLRKQSEIVNTKKAKQPGNLWALPGQVEEEAEPDL